MKPCRACRAGWVGLAVAFSALAWAATPADDAGDRERIHAERAAAEAFYVQQVQVCRAQFIVTSCINEARAQRHATLARLDQQQLALDEARRTQRATERVQGIDSKLSGDEARRREEAARERSANRRGGDEPKQAAPPASGAPPHKAKAAGDPAQRAELETRAQHAYELKQLQAEAHRQEVAQRNRDRAGKANPGAPLPTPGAASAAPAASAASAVLPKAESPARLTEPAGRR